MTASRAIEHLQAADAIKSLELYTTRPSNGPTELHCRLWGGLKSLSHANVETLCKELNTCIGGMTAHWHDFCMGNAQRALEHRESGGAA